MSMATTDTPKPETKFDAEAFAMNVARAMESGGKALAAYLKPRESGEVQDRPPAELTEVIKTFTAVAEYWLSDTSRASALQTKLAKDYLDLWGSAARRMAGQDAPPAIAPSPRDKRFADPEWKSNQFFDFMMQLYLLTTKFAQELVREAEGLDPQTRRKAEFYVQQVTNAISPSNFVLTNPEVLRATVASSGENLARGLKMLAEDIAAGKGTLKIRQSDPDNLVVGVNMATTPGKVIYQNEMMQLIQYAPATEKVLRTPLLIIPPWINKFYILDLKPEKSYIKWCVDQGITVFVISWVNPDKRLGAKSWEDYMKEGPLTAMDVIEKVTGEMKVHTAGYCVGGTMLATTLAWLAEKRRQRVASATFFAAQVDFTHAGDLLVFVDEEQIASLEQDMKAAGVLEGSKMAMAFNMLRSNDLIWSYVVSNYLKGQQPSAFDLLHWNSDATRMTASNHSYYLRNCYLENRLSTGTLVLDNTLLDLSKVMVPIYNLATREDHIAPAESVLYGSQFFGGPVKYVLSGSGHIAGVVNPPASNKYQYWTNDNVKSANVAEWMKGAVEHKGSWWPDWRQWLGALDPEEVRARTVGSEAFPPIEDAPGSYVRVRA
ncbi:MULTISPECIES: class I poly(R)-hydroxyalkanoic acid synthase [unclassified Bradyrhizobium]|jgi:polyhydroxyalkanoate synthase subunit PhaC|uniref:PHA/PHB synthase family protein n=1 Tax=unclassified Bradyrhizobium TaxID=2631580 RepID=UPI001FF991CE|nr:MULTISPECIES: class I poly(R)-hydroxyalkanoic acid synthase [unclassified Bradyrhizobium]MCK1346268.1 class I poly(R)-hydroxyalkanoic acid synthase [Bradyrhizobium sp. CW11]MCK1467979.1 class I poly(R)-hydroxyalkanoic acid synthase [Bradyrhizobium sp. CW10]MCK1484877.1 class I poly(R)-hydroxyalkanoic acid synthase [Bradyrhizobium sp. 193]MCK1582663.1 class I poly(R)-hydroxyalkanoic acid synthase [Bradyrhizobium sp. 168]MCK1588462.1 class I poly(R)-hydroxyalkanoic acid synthase [Bradyrhizobi